MGLVLLGKAETIENNIIFQINTKSFSYVNIYNLIKYFSPFYNVYCILFILSLLLICPISILVR